MLIGPEIPLPLKPVNTKCMSVTDPMPRKVVITVAPVSHPGTEVPAGSRNPLSPEEIAEEVTRCARAGAAMVHLHVRDALGLPTHDLRIFSRTLDLIAEGSDLIIQGSTGGLSTLTVEERSVCLEESRVEVASLNMGSVNFGDTVYVNTLPEIRYWAGRMKERRVLPEMEIFDLSMVGTCGRLASEGLLPQPLHYNFCLGQGLASALPATPRNLVYLTSLMVPGSHWGLNHDRMPGLAMLGCALLMGATVVRVGFEDSFYSGPGKQAASNAELVEALVTLVRKLGMEPASPDEARELMGLRTLRG